LLNLVKSFETNCTFAAWEFLRWKCFSFHKGNI